MTPDFGSVEMKVVGMTCARGVTKNMSDCYTPHLLGVVTDRGLEIEVSGDVTSRISSLATPLIDRVVLV